MKRARCGGAVWAASALLWVCMAAAGSEHSPDAGYVAAIESYRSAQDFRFRDRLLSPLTEPDRLTFSGLSYFPVEPSLALPATLERSASPRRVAMPTFDGGVREYLLYGVLRARLRDRTLTLLAFRPPPEPDRRDFLLVPFRDDTNGVLTYGGGRYIELSPVSDGSMVLDFNKAMNPLCAYDERYVCPVPPAENHIPLAIRAGEKRYR
jgi:uncharacterized protein (DUF1684 family)